MTHVSVRVIPNADQDHIIEDDDIIEVYTTKPAQAGKANQAAVSLVRKHLSVDGPIRIVSGHKQPNKILEIPE